MMFQHLIIHLHVLREIDLKYTIKSRQAKEAHSHCRSPSKINGIRPS